MNRETAWMIRQDGKAFACTSHYYADSEDAEDTLYAAEWLYKHTARCGTKCLILNLISAYAEGLSRETPDMSTRVTTGIPCTIS